MTVTTTTTKRETLAGVKPVKGRAGTVGSPDLVREAIEVARKGRRADQQLEQINARRLEIVAQLIEAGLHQQDVARLLGISRQRVTQIVDRLRESGRLPAPPAPPAASS